MLTNRTTQTARSYHGYAVAPATQLVLPCLLSAAEHLPPHGLLVLVDTGRLTTRLGSSTHSTTLQHHSATTPRSCSSEDVLNASYTRYAALQKATTLQPSLLYGTTSTPASQYKLQIWFSTSRLSDQSRQSSPFTYHCFCGGEWRSIDERRNTLQCLCSSRRAVHPCRNARWQAAFVGVLCPFAPLGELASRCSQSSVGGEMESKTCL